MTRKGRIMAAVRHQGVDGCPHVTYNIHPYSETAHARDRSYAEILAQVEATAGVAVKVAAGGAGIDLSRIQPDRSEVTVEARGAEQVITETLHTQKGDLVRVSSTMPGEPAWTVKHFIESDEDIERLLSLPYEPPEFDVSGVRAVVEAVGDRGIVLAGFTEPMYAVVSLFHFEDFCVRALTDLPGLKRVVDWAFERCLENTRLLVRACEGLDCIFHTSGPEVCTPPMVSPAVFAELVTPYLRRLIEVIHGAGKLAAIHCHGRVREVFPEMLKTGADLLEPVEPPPQGNIALAELLEHARDRICLMGYVQDQDFYTAPPGYMTRWVEQIARIVDGRSGYIMCPTCTPFDFPCTDTYKRNYMEWLQAADRLL